MPDFAAHTRPLATPQCTLRPSVLEDPHHNPVRFPGSDRLQNAVEVDGISAGTLGGLTYLAYPGYPHPRAGAPLFVVAG